MITAFWNSVISSFCVLFINRLCFSCKDDIEDEFHFIFKCPLYETLRKTDIKPIYRNKPSVFKLVMLFTSENIKDMCEREKFLWKAMELRNSLL